MPEPLDEQYLTWLYARIGSLKEVRKSQTYWSLFRCLYEREFIWFVPNDDNRVEDGRDLRYEFLDETAQSGNVDPEWMGMGCSVLELIMGLAKRLSFEADMTARHWFWVLLHNLDLDELNDSNFDESRVSEAIGTLIYRTYSPSGHGGLFPLNYPHQDQREVELWYQLCSYILERD